MRSSEAYWHVGGLVTELNEVEANAMKFLDAGDADTALAILLALIEEAGEGFEVIDDSDGEFGGYLSDIGQPLAEAILMLDLSVVERQTTQRSTEESRSTVEQLRGRWRARRCVRSAGIWLGNLATPIAPGG